LNHLKTELFNNKKEKQMAQTTTTTTKPTASKVKIRSFQVGAVHWTRFGPARVVDRLPCLPGKAQELSIQFLETNYVCTVFLTNLRTGNVTDPIKVLQDKERYSQSFKALQRRLAALMGAGVLAEFLPESLKPALA
jgi:hypothetical protein